MCSKMSAASPKGALCDTIQVPSGVGDMEQF